MGKPPKPKSPSTPPPVAPAPTVQETEPMAEDVMKKQIKRSGYQKTILAGSLTPFSGKKVTLGG